MPEIAAWKKLAVGESIDIITSDSDDRSRKIRYWGNDNRQNLWCELIDGTTCRVTRRGDDDERQMPRSTQKLWTAEENVLLHELVAKGVDNASIRAQFPDRSKTSVEVKARELRRAARRGQQVAAPVAPEPAKPVVVVDNPPLPPAEPPPVSAHANGRSEIRAIRTSASVATLLCLAGRTARRTIGNPFAVPMSRPRRPSLCPSTSRPGGRGHEHRIHRAL